MRGMPLPASVTIPRLRRRLYTVGLRRTWMPAGNWSSRMEIGSPPGVRTSTRSSKTSRRIGPAIV